MTCEVAIAADRTPQFVTSEHLIQDAIQYAGVPPLHLKPNMSESKANTVSIDQHRLPLARKQHESGHVDRLLDEALEATFPASDPIAIAQSGSSTGQSSNRRRRCE